MVYTKDKANLKSNIIIQDINSHYSRKHCLSYNIFAKIQAQGIIAKNFYFKKPKTKEFKLTS